MIKSQFYVSVKKETHSIANYCQRSLKHLLRTKIHVNCVLFSFLLEYSIIRRTMVSQVQNRVRYKTTDKKFKLLLAETGKIILRCPTCRVGVMLISCKFTVSRTLTDWKIFFENLSVRQFIVSKPIRLFLVSPKNNQTLRRFRNIYFCTFCEWFFSHSFQILAFTYRP